MLRVTPLYGAESHNPKIRCVGSLPPNATLIEYAGVRLLVNVGGGGSSTNVELDTIMKQLLSEEDQTIDAILLSDSTMECLGGLPRYFAPSNLVLQQGNRRQTDDDDDDDYDDDDNKRRRRKKRKKQRQRNIERRRRQEQLNNKSGGFGALLKRIPPIYTTYPTLQLGPMTLYDYHSNVSLDGEDPGFKLDDVDALFAPTASNDTFVKNSDSDHDDSSSDDDSDRSSSSDDGESDDEEDDNDSDDDSNEKKLKDDISSRTYIQTLKYSQSIFLAPRRNTRKKKKKGVSGHVEDDEDHSSNRRPTICITPHRSGHVLGGAYWILQRLSDETSIVICPNGSYNPSRELHLDHSTIVTSQSARSPDAMIISPGGMAGGILGRLYQSQQQPQQTTKRQQEGSGGSTTTSPVTPTMIPPVLKAQPWRTIETTLVDEIMGVLRRNGNVLLPTDACGRVLELLLLLDTYWNKQRLSNSYHLIWVGSMTHNILSYVQSQLEWMNSNLGKQFDSGATSSSKKDNSEVGGNKTDTKGGTTNTSSSFGNPFQFRCIKVCTTTREVEELERDGLPIVLIASATAGGCDYGPARDWLLRWGEEQDNAIIFTDAQICTLREDPDQNSPSNDDGSDGNNKITRSRSLLPSSVGSSTAAAAAAAAASTALSSGTSDPRTSLLRRSSSFGHTKASLMDGTATSSAKITIGASDKADIMDDGATVATGATEAAGGVHQHGSNLPIALNPSDCSAAAQLLRAWCDAKSQHQEMEDLITIDIKVPARKPLEGEELYKFRHFEEQKLLKIKRQKERAELMKEVELAKGRLHIMTGGGGGTTTTGVGTKPTRTSSTTKSSSGVRAEDKKDHADSAREGDPMEVDHGTKQDEDDLKVDDHGDVKREKTEVEASGSDRKQDGSMMRNRKMLVAMAKKRRRTSRQVGGVYKRGGGTHAKKKFDSNLFLKYSKPQSHHMMFPEIIYPIGIGQESYVGKFGIVDNNALSVAGKGKVLVDDYGIAVKHSKFHDLVTGSDSTKYSQRSGGTGRLADDALFNRQQRQPPSGSISIGTKFRPAATVTAAEEEDDDPMKKANAIDKDEDDLDEAALEIMDLSEGKGIIRGRHGRPPIKVYTVARQMEILAEISYISLEGRVSARAGRQTVRALQPRQLVILGGSEPSPYYYNHTKEGESRRDVHTTATTAVVTDDESTHPRGGTSSLMNKGKEKKESKKGLDAEKNDAVVVMGEAELLADAMKELVVSNTSTINDKDTEGLSSTSKKSSAIWIPNNLQSVQLNVGHSAYAVRLIDTPFVMEEEETTKHKAKVKTDDDQKEKDDDVVMEEPKGDNTSEGLDDTDATKKEAEEEENETEDFSSSDDESDDVGHPDDGSTTPANVFHEIEVGQYQVCPVDCIATGQKVAVDGSIVLAPRGSVSKSRRQRRLSKEENQQDPSNSSIMLSDGEVLLTELMGEFIAEGMKAEYKTTMVTSTEEGQERVLLQQVLIVNGRIFIRKNVGGGGSSTSTSGHISIEGPLCQDYFFARSRVCAKYTTIL